MNRFTKGSVVLFFIFVAAVMSAGCSPGFVPPGKETSPPVAAPPASSVSGPTNGLKQTNDGGSVTIALTWQGEKGNSLVFNVAMDTHSVDLDQYDLGKLAILRDDNAKEYRPTSWQARPGGHHRTGTLTFPLPDSLSQGQTKSAEIVIRDVSGIQERVLRWEL
ncbi:MAG: hypothetical protein HYX80_09995 [Chloroflexi bacterium]|nr:hypothetical protein [Chloroflexota bacterium]